ncbi:T9SS type A sorting domain-containing protein [Candidatus Poribacteria bacterium]|nr:T9SS type A sorting domain-containing protein [Candidatus Poribacteria bacterium]
METSIKDLPPGEFVELPLMVKPAYEQGVCENVPYSFSVKATSGTNPNISSTVKANFTIKPGEAGAPVKKQLTLSLHKGINIISIPFKNDWRLSDLIRLTGEYDVTMVIYYDYQDEKFVAYMLRFGENVKSNVPVQCGEGYVVVMKTDKQVVFEGYSCEDEAIPAAPQMPMILSNDVQKTSVFLVTGYVMDETGTAQDGIRVTVRNQRTGQTLQSTTGAWADSGQYVITFVASSPDMMTSAGDQLEISAIDETHRLKMSPIIYTLTDAELSVYGLYMPPLRLRVIPEHSALLPNYPNPFNPETWLPYQLADDAAVTISIYNQRGQLVRNIVLGNQAADVYISKDKAAYWDGRNNVGEKVANGVYFYNLQAGEFTDTRRMLIVK